MSMRLPIAVIGAGVIGRTHIDRVLTNERLRLVAIADPSPAAAELAQTTGTPHFADYREMLRQAKPRAVVIATPNATQAQISVDCLEAGAAVLVEKPIAD